MSNVSKKEDPIEKEGSVNESKQEKLHEGTDSTDAVSETAGAEEQNQPVAEEKTEAGVSAESKEPLAEEPVAEQKTEAGDEAVGAAAVHNIVAYEHVHDAGYGIKRHIFC